MLTSATGDVNKGIIYGWEAVPRCKGQKGKKPNGLTIYKIKVHWYNHGQCQQLQDKEHIALVGGFLRLGSSTEMAQCTVSKCAHITVEGQGPGIDITVKRGVQIDNLKIDDAGIIVQTKIALEVENRFDSDYPFLIIAVWV